MLAAGQVIDAMASRLSGLPLAGTRIYTSRTWPLAEEELPAWRVLAKDEDIEPITVHPNALQTHALQIELRGYARAVADLDDALHALAAQAIAAVFSLTPPADALASLASKMQLSQRRIERGMATEGEAVVGMVVVTLRAVYRTWAASPETLN